MSLESVVGRLVLLKHVNDGVYSDPNQSEESLAYYTEQTIVFLFDASQQEQARQEAACNGKFRPVSDQALLATLELALLSSPRDGIHWINDDLLRSELTHVLLSFQDVLISRACKATIEACGRLEALGPKAWHEFIRNRMAHNTGRYYRRALGRLFAMCHDPEVDLLVRERTGGKSVQEWFVKAFGLTPKEYLGCAFLAVAPAWNMKLQRPDVTQAFYRPATCWNLFDTPYRAKARELLGLASRPIGDPGPVPDVTIDDFLYAACGAHVHPVLDFGDVAVAVSPHLVMNKYVVGLPYLAQEFALRNAGRPLSNSEVTAARAPFGFLFESYVIWLLRRFLSNWNRTEIIAPAWCGPIQTDGECDIVIVRGDTAYVFEVKSTLATLAFRQTGSFSGLDSILRDGAEQAYRAALALRAGNAVRASNRSPIEGIRFVVPCVITYEDIPLYELISDFYEDHLAALTQMSLFRSQNGIEPLQFFDVDFLESWETSFDLSPNSGAPFAYLLCRARDPLIRHRPIKDGIVAGNRPEAPTPFDDVTMESKRFLESLARSWRQPNQADQAK